MHAQSAKTVYMIIDIKHNRILITLVLVCMCMPAYSRAGNSCSDPIVLGPNYSEVIYSAGSTWYIANTFDLPMAIDFYPTNPASPAPELELDFSCTPGVYDDPILCSLFCSSQSAYIALPHKETPPKSYDPQGNVRYHVEFGEFYRDMLLSQGIDYNVPVYIKVTYHGSGSLQMDPDPFNNCMDGHKFMHLGDTVKVKAHDGDRHVIVPYVQWQYDSIRYVWTGTTPCKIAIGNTCGFDPTDAEDATIIDGGVIQPDGQFKVSSALLMQYVSDQVNYPNDAGMYFAKFYSEEPGVMKIEKIPASPPAAGATLLKYGTQTTVRRNDTAALYAMPDSWIKAMQFSTPTDHIFKMYVGATPNFYTKDTVATFQFDRTTDGHVLSLFAEDMEKLWLNKSSGDHYLYVRFECTDNTTVLPTLWTPSDCMMKAPRLKSGVQFDVVAKSTTNYGLFYADWKGGDMKIAWTSTQSTCSFFIADTCNIPNTNVSPVFYTDKAPKRGSVTIQASEVNTWEPYVDPDGYIYIRFYSQAKGKITVTTTAPKEEDPACSPEDSTLIVTAWDSFIWNGMAYTESGVYTHDGNVDPETGCVDTVFTLRLTIHTTGYDTYNETGCDSIVYNGKKYVESGVYTDTLFDGNGNRTIMTLNFTIHHATTGEDTQTACDSLLWNGKWYNESGDYTFKTTNAAGCDSTATLHLTINHSVQLNMSGIDVCGSYLWGDTLIETSGTYTRRLHTISGCDSIVTQTIRVHQPVNMTLPDTAVCETDYGYEYVWSDPVMGDTTIRQNGTYTRRFKTQYGCDSIVTQTVRFLDMTYGSAKVTAYDSYTTNMGMTYTKSVAGAIDYYTNAAGCDSVVTLDLKIRHLQVNDTFPQTICATELPFQWYGKSYMESGIYTTDTIEGGAVNGVYMDTVHTVNLMVLPTSAGDTAAAACESFVWYGETYSASGEYNHTLTNVVGCDSVVTLHLTIYHATTGDTSAVACNAYDWYGKTYTESGEYNHTLEGGNSHGCDSVITLHLTIHTSTTGEETKEVCNEYEWHGTTYTTSGDYTFTTANAAGCDSTVTLHLTINDCAVTYDTVYFCAGHNTEHEELLEEAHVRRYLAYVYESPAEWDYMEGAILVREKERMQVDLRRAEQNLYAHYVNELTPVNSIRWSYRADGENDYRTLEVADEPQWVETGTIAVMVRFVCGQFYTSDFEADVVMVSDDRLEVGGKKVLENGQIVIIRGGVKYNIFGLKL